MDVLTEQRKLNATIYDIIKRLKFKNYKMNLFGTSSLQSQRFYSDYDFNTHISRTHRPIVLYNEFVQILSNQDMYFIELKIEYTNNTKRKIFDVTKLTKSMFNNYFFLEIIKCFICCFGYSSSMYDYCFRWCRCFRCFSN